MNIRFTHLAPVLYSKPDTVDDFGVYLCCYPDEVESVLSLPRGPANTDSENGKQELVYSTAEDLQENDNRLTL